MSFYLGTDEVLEIGEVLLVDVGNNPGLVPFAGANLDSLSELSYYYPEWDEQSDPIKEQDQILDPVAVMPDPLWVVVCQLRKLVCHYSPSLCR